MVEGLTSSTAKHKEIKGSLKARHGCIGFNPTPGRQNVEVETNPRTARTASETDFVSLLSVSFSFVLFLFFLKNDTFNDTLKKRGESVFKLASKTSTPSCF